jgi:hypothetical protein
MTLRGLWSRVIVSVGSACAFVLCTLQRPARRSSAVAGGSRLKSDVIVGETCGAGVCVWNLEHQKAVELSLKVFGQCKIEFTAYSYNIGKG